MHEGTRDGDTPSVNLNTVRITRAPMPPTVYKVRMLGELDGLPTHWVRTTVPCYGDGCRYCRQMMPREFRGYVAAELRDAGRQRWFPTVVEVTERMYWSLQTPILRGTVWHLFREVHGRNKTTCLAELVGEVDPKELPPRFDISSVVRRLYHNLPLTWGYRPELGAPLELPSSLDPDATEAPAAEDTPQDSIYKEFPKQSGERVGDYLKRVDAIRLQREGKVS